MDFLNLYMPDVHEPEVRSYNMSRIRSKNTKPELLVRKYLHRLGFRYRIHVAKLPGKPDIVLTRYKTVVLIHGCFWHSHKGCKYFQIPSTRQDYWIPKLKTNKQKDRKHLIEIQHLGWKTIVIWECELKKERQHGTLEELVGQLKIQ